MKVFITKYALSAGIQEIDARLSDFNLNMIRDSQNYRSYHKPYWHETKEAAIIKAEDMRVKKIAALKKQIENLENLRFN